MKPGENAAPHISLKRVYLTGLLLATVLFVMHTLIIFHTVVLLSHVAQPAIGLLGAHFAGPALILGCFFILFITHLAEAAIWAVVLWKIRQFPTFGESLYFSGTSLTALGYGDVVLHPPWRGLGPVMATNGILMFGCSTAFLFFVIQHIWSLL